MVVSGLAVSVQEQVGNTAVCSGDTTYNNSVNPIAQGCGESC